MGIGSFIKGQGLNDGGQRSLRSGRRCVDKIFTLKQMIKKWCMWIFCFWSRHMIGSCRDSSELMKEWFNLVHEKNTLVRWQEELTVKARELELEDRHVRLEIC